MAALCKSLSTLTLADQIANALANIAWEGLHEPNSLELASAALAQEEWQSCKEQPDPHDLVKERVIGEGGYSVVYLVRDVRTNRQFGLKRLRKGFMANLGLVERVLMEKEAHEELRHPFICHLYTTFQDADSLYFVLELARGGDLFELIELHGGQLSEPASRHYLGSVALGLQHMHTHGYVYRDLKVRACPARCPAVRSARSAPGEGRGPTPPTAAERGGRGSTRTNGVATPPRCRKRATPACIRGRACPHERNRSRPHLNGPPPRAQPENVLIDGHGFVKIADLGYAKFVKGKRTFSSLGTVTYAPPELLGGRGRTKAADWW